MRYPVVGRMVALIALLLVPILGCSSSESSPSSPPAAADAGDTSCENTCAVVGALCGSTPSQCVDVCSSYSEGLRRCVVTADSCATANACQGARGEETPDAGIRDSGRD